MADKNIQLKNLEGDLLFPKTKIELVVGATEALDGKVDKHQTGGVDDRLITEIEAAKLADIEADAQVNVLEGVQVNGEDLTVDANKKVNVLVPVKGVKLNGVEITPDTDHKVDITLPVAAQYSVAKKSTADTGYVASYQLMVKTTVDGSFTPVVGADTIQIPKDFLVKSASVKLGSECTPQQTPLDHKFIDFVINTEDQSETEKHLFVDINDLVDVYTAGDGLDLAGNEFSVKLATTDSGLEFDANGALTVDTDFVAKKADLDDHIADTVAHITATERTTWNAKQDALVDSATITYNDTTKQLTAVTMSAASASAAGAAGIVPAPAAGDEVKFLTGAATWIAGVTYTELA